MPLQTGTWTINVNGTVDQLGIINVDAQGALNGFLGGGPFVGFWDEASQKITFSVRSGILGGGGGSLQVYTGFLFEDQVRITNVAGGTVFTLAGFFEQFEAPPIPTLTGKRNVFGWYAQIGEQ